jgi:hypothetical protein
MSLFLSLLLSLLYATMYVFPHNILLEASMKHLSNEITLRISKLDRNSVQLILLLVTLGMLVIGAGAPVSSGGPGG